MIKLSVDGEFLRQSLANLANIGWAKLKTITGIDANRVVKSATNKLAARDKGLR